MAKGLYPEIVAVKESEFPAFTSHSAELPASDVGDILFAAISLVAASGGITAATPAGWTELRKITNTLGVSHVAALHSGFYARVSPGTVPGESVDFPTTESVAGVSQVYRFKRTSAVANAFISTTSQGGPGTSANSPALDAPWGATKTLWLSALVFGKDGALATVTQPPGYTGLVQTRQSSGAVRAGLAIAFRESQAASEDAGPFTLSASNDFNVWMGAIEAADLVHVPAGGRRNRVVAEVDGIDYEIDTPEQLRELQAKAHEAEVERSQLKRLERISEEMAERRHRERAAQLRVERMLERQVLTKINAERELKAAQDRLNVELAERLVIQPERTRFNEPKRTITLSSSTGIRGLGRKR